MVGCPSAKLPRLPELNVDLQRLALAQRLGPHNSTPFLPPLVGHGGRSEYYSAATSAEARRPTSRAFESWDKPAFSGTTSADASHVHQQLYPLLSVDIARRRTRMSPVAPGRRSRRAPKGPRGSLANVKYTPEQVHFIVYFRVDHHLSWGEVTAKYCSAFEKDRRIDGLQPV
ncbi:hypothetical protein CMUS01_14796 [Colletotrichum musicola]|uniref:Uncharacterized protein n=1 Tax=Colletotrichum musicola TaxID=2175873 RepID=A0A8H6J195_9PEZI|nr:hypothetical protein CMUS01_14796 [Colletotrichum musicola]